MTVCVCVLFDWPGNPLCGEPAAALVVLGCVHEHLEQDWLCSRHVALAKQNTLICSECKTGSRAHSCQVFALAEVNETGERRLLVGASTACPSCCGTFPGEGPDEWVCRCGSGWAADAGAHEAVAA